MRKLILSCGLAILSAYANTAYGDDCLALTEAEKTKLAGVLGEKYAVSINDYHKVTIAMDTGVAKVTYPATSALVYDVCGKDPLVACAGKVSFDCPIGSYIKLLSSQGNFRIPDHLTRAYTPVGTGFSVYLCGGGKIFFRKSTVVPQYGTWEASDSQIEVAQVSRIAHECGAGVRGLNLNINATRKLKLTFSNYIPVVGATTFTSTSVYEEGATPIVSPTPTRTKTPTTSTNVTPTPTSTPTRAPLVLPSPLPVDLNPKLVDPEKSECIAAGKAIGGAQAKIAKSNHLGVWSMSAGEKAAAESRCALGNKDERYKLQKGVAGECRERIAALFKQIHGDKPAFKQMYGEAGYDFNGVGCRLDRNTPDAWLAICQEEKKAMQCLKLCVYEGSVVCAAVFGQNPPAPLREFSYLESLNQDRELALTTLNMVENMILFAKEDGCTVDPALSLCTADIAASVIREEITQAYLEELAATTSPTPTPVVGVTPIPTVRVVTPVPTVRSIATMTTLISGSEAIF